VRHGVGALDLVGDTAGLVQREEGAAAGDLDEGRAGKNVAEPPRERELVGYAISVGRVAEQPAEPLSHVLIGALDEAALYVAKAGDPARARREVGAVLDALVRSLTV